MLHLSKVYTYLLRSWVGCRDKKSLFVIPIEPTVQPLDIPLVDGGEVFWLDSRTIALVSKNKKSDTLDLYALSVQFETQTSLTTTTNPTFIGSFPTATVTNFRYSLSIGTLVFSYYVWPDGDLMSVKEQDEAWENRGNTALVYDETYARHWDHWITPKRSKLFSARLYKDADRKWHLGNDFANTMKHTNHVCFIQVFNFAY